MGGATPRFWPEVLHRALPWELMYAESGVTPGGPRLAYINPLQLKNWHPSPLQPLHQAPFPHCQLPTQAAPPAFPGSPERATPTILGGRCTGTIPCIISRKHCPFLQTTLSSIKGCLALSRGLSPQRRPSQTASLPACWAGPGGRGDSWWEAPQPHPKARAGPPGEGPPTPQIHPGQRCPWLLHLSPHASLGRTERRVGRPAVFPTRA